MDFLKSAAKAVSNIFSPKITFKEVSPGIASKLAKVVPPKFRKEKIVFYSLDKNKLNLFNADKEYVYTVGKEEVFESVTFHFQPGKKLTDYTLNESAEYYSKKYSNLI